MNNITPVYIALFEGWKLVVEKHAKGDTCEPRRCFSLTTHHLLPCLLRKLHDSGLHCTQQKHLLVYKAHHAQPSTASSGEEHSAHEEAPECPVLRAPLVSGRGPCTEK